jgi:hypothetical protein
MITIPIYRDTESGLQADRFFLSIKILFLQGGKKSFTVKLKMMLSAFVFHSSIVATLGSKAYHWGTFIAAEIFANVSLAMSQG